MAKTVRKINKTILDLPKKKRVAAYARVSSGKDAMLHSLSAQVSYYSNYIQNHPGWEYVGVYADEALTGTKETRPEFQRLLADCRAGKIDMIITKSISRFARNTVTMLKTVRELKSINIDVFFERENIHSMNGDGELMLTILSSFAQEESRSVSENCKWRIRNKLQEGTAISFNFMYGYRLRNGRIKINEEEADVVRMIFHDYLNGMGSGLIAKKLDSMGIERPREGKWKSSRVLEILKNERYTGNALFQKSYILDHISKKLVTNNGELPKYYCESTHEPIIDLDAFNRVQEIIESNRSKCNIKKQAANNYLFTSKITCCCCGKNYIRKVNHGRPAWNCSTYLQFGREKCQAKQIPEQVLYSVTSDVLGLTDFDEAVFIKYIKKIEIPGPNRIKYVFYNGDIKECEWKDRSRSESWDDAAREKARNRNKRC